MPHLAPPLPLDRVHQLEATACAEVNMGHTVLAEQLSNLATDLRGAP